MRRRLLFIVLAVIFCSGGFAQSDPNSFSMPLDTKLKDVQSVPCADNGLCVVTETVTKKVRTIGIHHRDTAFRPQWDTAIALPSDWKRQHLFYENGAVVCLYRSFQGARSAERGLLYIYHTDRQSFETREVVGLPTDASTLNWHYLQGDLFFTVVSRRSQEVWFLPAGVSCPAPFPFTRENPGTVLTTATDPTQGKAVICFTSGERTMYFETDSKGNSSFANILDEPATGAQWVRISHDHSLLMLHYQDDDSFYMHPVNILNHKVTPSDTVYCADLNAPKSLPGGVKGKRLILVTPHNYVSFLPTQAQRCNDAVAFTTELYYAEYTNYFNGWYVEPRFNGYRYERADVHFFDTNGVFITNVTFPYDEIVSLHSRIINKLRTTSLQNRDILLYCQVGHDITTMLLDSGYRVKDPVRTSSLPLPRVPFKNQKFAVDRMEPWYGDDQFLLSAYRIRITSQKKVAFEARKLKYE